MKEGLSPSLWECKKWGLYFLGSLGLWVAITIMYLYLHLIFYSCMVWFLTECVTTHHVGFCFRADNSLKESWGPIWLEPVQVLCMLPQSLWVHMCISPIVSRKHYFLGVIHYFIIFLPPIPHRSLNPEGTHLIKLSHLGLITLSASKLSPSAHCPVVIICINSYIL